MSEQNRFADMVSGININSGEEKTADEPSTQKAVKKSKRKKSVSSDPFKAPYQKSDNVKVKRGDELSKGKSSDENYDKVTVYIRADVAHALRVVCAHQKDELSGYVEAALVEQLENNSIGKAILEEYDFSS